MATQAAMAARKRKAKQEALVERQQWMLDEGLRETFPASDPVAIVMPHREPGTRRRRKPT